MKRRQFLAASIATSAAALAGTGAAQPAPAGKREYYQLRRYSLIRGTELQLTQNYFKDALIPAATRMGLGPIGAFSLDIGPETPTYYLLIPGTSLETLVNLDPLLAKDEEFLKVAAPYWDATAAAPAFQRIETSLLAAFDGWPRITPPASSATKAKRIFQLRSYESPSNGEHVRKLEMFPGGEYQIFKDVGFRPLFYGDMLMGPRMPNMTYMLSFDNIDELYAKWDTEMNGAAWKALSTSKRYGFDPIVDVVSNQVLSPLDCSQI
jgi:hypothetical protein